jgi:lipopolysaccharide assembly protein A
MRLVSILLTLIIIIIGVAFAALNADSVQVNYLIGVKSLPLAMMLLIALVIGSLLSLIILSLSLLRLKAKNKWLAHKLKQAKEELAHPKQSATH